MNDSSATGHNGLPATPRDIFAPFIRKTQRNMLPLLALKAFAMD